MTQEEAWKIWFAIVDKLEENGHTIRLTKTSECGGDYVDCILNAIKK